MVSETSSQPVEQQTQMQAKKKPDDPMVTIKQFLDIVDTLHKKVNKSQEEEGSVLTKSRSATQLAGPEPTPNGQEPFLGHRLSLPTNPINKSEEDHHISKLQRNLRLLKEDVIKLQDLRTEVAEEVTKHIPPLRGLLGKVEKEEQKSSKTQLTKGMKKDLEEINKKIFNLMCQVPLLPNKRKKNNGLDSEDGDPENNGKGIVCLLGIHASDERLKRLAVFRDVQDKFEELDKVEKICLLTFAMFPENQEVNRTMLMYWWLGEGILPIAPKKDSLPPQDGVKKILPIAPKKDSQLPEEDVKKILNTFMEKKLIEPVANKRKVEPNSYKMTPFVHSSVVLISSDIGLFKMYPKEKKPSMMKSDLKKVCLVEGSSSQQEAKAKKMSAEDIETVFNVSERFPDFAFKWFSEEQPSGNKKYGPLSKTKYKKLKVFYLGRWERTAKRHIEVENPELMKYLKPMTKLRLLSFQGISRIEKLDDAVCKLRELIILDLRACYNLEKLPYKIDSLKKLIYLDITDCYMIDRMPKRLSWLDNLEVLKGFVVSDATDEETVCMLVELKHLEKLRKLSITINKRDYTVEELFKAIKNFKSLEKLKVAWGGMNKRPVEKKDKGTDEQKKQNNKEKGIDGGKKQDKKDEATAAAAPAPAPAAAANKRGFLERTKTMILGEKNPVEEAGIPKTLKKLDLQCFPEPNLPEWLDPGKLSSLERLYIKGGTEITKFGKVLPEEATECSVKVLRLKFLPKLKVEWRDLSKIYFPKLEFLEKYQCPQVSFCPCDGIGIWRKET